MLENILSTILRGAITYVYVMILARIMGRKLISQMTFFDFVVGITMGALAGSVAMGPFKMSVTAATALAVFTVLGVATAFADIKFFKFGKLITSEPVTLINNGTIVEDNMKKVRLAIEELNMKLREKNIFNVADVEFAIMETDGQLSVLPKSDKKPVTPADMNIQTVTTGLMRDVIIDGKIMEENLKAGGFDDNWLQWQLKMQGIGDASEVFFAGVDNTKKLYVSKKNAGNDGHDPRGANRSWK